LDICITKNVFFPLPPILVSLLLRGHLAFICHRASFITMLSVLGLKSVKLSLENVGLTVMDSLLRLLDVVSLVALNRHVLSNCFVVHLISLSSGLLAFSLLPSVVLVK